MDFTELTNKRYSVRKFLPAPLTSGEIEAILAVGANAPTACNKQPQRIYVVKSPRALAAVRECTRCHFDAPVLFVVCYDEDAWNAVSAFCPRTELLPKPYVGIFKDRCDSISVEWKMVGYFAAGMTYWRIGAA